MSSTADYKRFRCGFGFGCSTLITGGYLYSGMSGVSPLIAPTATAARVQFTVARVVYYHRGTESFVSPKVSYSCNL